MICHKHWAENLMPLDILKVYIITMGEKLVFCPHHLTESEIFLLISGPTVLVSTDCNIDLETITSGTSSGLIQLAMALGPIQL